MNLEKVVFAFFIVLAATLNFGFFIGDIDRPELHHVGRVCCGFGCEFDCHFVKVWRPLTHGGNTISHQLSRFTIGCRRDCIGDIKRKSWVK
jgi:hypothetical protein